MILPEIELKLEIEQHDLKTLLASNIFGKPDKILNQRSVYFDTRDRALTGSGFTLRIRYVDGRRIQTVKALGAGNSLFARDEWEMLIEDDVPVLDHTNPLRNEFGQLADDVMPQFEVVIERRVWDLTEGGTAIEAVLDQGFSSAIGRQSPIVEMELELKDGNPADIFVLARKIAASVPVRIGVASKSERGFLLLEAVRSVVKAEPIDLHRTMTAFDCFQMIVNSCFRQFRQNETILLAMHNGEALHQARVALRRLRSALTLFKPILDEEQGKRFSSDFRWLAGLLGEVRDLDVLIPKAGDGELKKRLIERRGAAFEMAQQVLDQPRARNLMLDFNDWVLNGARASLLETRTLQEEMATDFASKALDKLRRKLKKHGRDLKNINDEQRHEARKTAKKLRYASEFFATLYTDKRSARRHKRFTASMEELQDCLGGLNDLATGPVVLDDHGLRDHPQSSALLSHADKASLVVQAQTALDDVLDAKRFWQ